MNIKNWLLPLLLISCAVWSEPGFQAQVGLSVVPEPQIVEIGDGGFTVGNRLRIHAPEQVQGIVQGLSERLASSNIHVQRVTDEQTASVRFSLDNSMGSEAYHLSINTQGITIIGGDQAGLFYGVQTLLQLMPPQVYGKTGLMLPVSLPAVVISDAPRFEWRGLMVDLSRHFVTKEVLKKTIDRMAMHKLNRLHLHLTDDPGWRLEIKKYPELVNIGARGNRSNPNGPAEYLTQADIRELVAYAQDRFIDVVPEIDMPGHAGAAAKAYPEFFDGNITYNMGKKETYGFVQDVLDEVVELFPSPYIHFGGDELRNHRLDELPEVQAMMKEKGFKSIYELEGYFDRFVSDYIASKDRTPIGWDEVANYDIGNDAIVQWWRGRNPEARDYAVNQGYRVILSPADHIYLDYPQAVGEPGAPWEGNDNGPNSIELIYNWQMVPESYSTRQEQQIIGIEAAVWTEFIRSEHYMEFMTFPRLAAIAEIAWVAKGNRDMHRFERRLQKQYQRYEAMGINYRIPVPGDSLGKNAGQYLSN